MAKNSRKKGKTGELELACLINDRIGYRCLIRNLDQSRDGGHDLVVSDTRTLEARRLDQMAIEVKRHRQTRPANIREWWQQTYDQARRLEKIPVLFYRADREEWTAMLPLSKSLTWDDHCHCVSMGLPLFLKILKTPDLMDIQP